MSNFQPLDDVEHLIYGENLPVNVGMDIVNRCNVSCRMCGGALYVEEKGFDKYSRLGFDDIMKFFSDVQVSEITFVGSYSEPFMNRDIIPTSRKLIAHGAKVTVITNATLITRDLAEDIVRSGIHHIYVSIHGATKETAEFVMRGAKFDTVTQNLRNLMEIRCELGSRTPHVTMNMVLMRENIADAPKMIELARELGVDGVAFANMRLPDFQYEPESFTVSLITEDLDVSAKHLTEASNLAKEYGVALNIPQPLRPLLAG
ncbi:hypothetical protein ACP90_20680 [Labrenzia sp. CP4]|jgi:MoaA/NifB/PqqE/SkfB family radical SAM enzyme|uniref:radical SAM protein n=1 Tax=Labrenzia sp. CP4 TaxID=1674922 RepID=UPI0007841496|nr:radical SAM protein [Labrenzia sp. CP4]AMN54420.1 hypothetical protein ACP90_20680 [Labrenzia sp. CP4]